jgi:hypothetical protein
MHYITYNNTTGEILGHGECDESYLLAIKNAQHPSIEGTGTSTDSYILNGVITPYTTPQVNLKATKPSGYIWSNTTMSWVDNRSLLSVQEIQNSLLQKAYEQAIIQPVLYTSIGGITSTYQADAKSISNITAMQLAFAAIQTVPNGFYWVAEDNTHIPFVYRDIQGLATALGIQGFTSFAHLQIKKAEVLAATTNIAVEAIVW